MKILLRHWLLVLLPAFMLITACEKGNITSTFTRDVGPVDFTVDTTGQTGEIMLDSSAVHPGLQDLLDDNGLKLNDVKSIKITEMTFTIEDSVNNFDFLESLQSGISGDTLPVKIIAEKNTIPDDSLITLHPDIKKDLGDIESYIRQKTLYMTTRGVTTAPIKHPLKLSVKFAYKVRATISSKRQ